jgi:AcrR family transcriptional regulator
VTQVKKKMGEESQPATGDRETRQQILKAARQLFLARGYKGVSMKDVAEEVQVTSAALYYHFPDGKQDLFFSVIQMMLEEWTRGAVLSTASAQGLRERLTRLTQYLFTLPLDRFSILIRDIHENVLDHGTKRTIVLQIRDTFSQQGGQPERQNMTLLETGDVPLLRWVTTHRLITIAGALVIFFGSIALIPRLGTNFFNNSSQNTFSITQTLPVSTSLQQTDQAAQQVEAVLSSVPGIQTYQVMIGSSGSVASSFSGGSGSNSASYAVTTDPNADQVALQQTVHDRLYALTGVGTITLSASSQGFNSSNLAVNVQASDDQTLRAATQLVLGAVK